MTGRTTGLMTEPMTTHTIGRTMGQSMRYGRVLVVLVVLNAVLVAGVLLQRAVPRAYAQGGRARGEYTMVSGKTNAGGPHAIYVLDSANQEMVALRWDPARRVLGVIGYRNLSGDANAKPGR